MVTDVKKDALPKDKVSILQLNHIESIDDAVSGEWELHGGSAKISSKREKLADLVDIPKGTKLTNETVSGLLSESGIAVVIGYDFRDLMRFIEYSDVDGLDDDVRNELFMEVANGRIDEVNAELSQMYDNGKVKLNLDAVKGLRIIRTRFADSNNPSQKTIDEIQGEIHEIREQYRGAEVSDHIHTWMDSAVSHLSKDRVIKETLQLLLTGYDKFKNQRSRQLDDGMIDDYRETYMVTHGKFKAPINNILSVLYFPHEGSDNGLATVSLNGSDRSSLFGVYMDYNPLEPVPHRLPLTLGSFYNSALRIAGDSFSDFIKGITNIGKKNDATGEFTSAEEGLREQLLEYLQTGLFTYNHDGVRFEYEAPGMILACDNDDPFTTIEGIFLGDEQGLRGRIHLVDVPSIANNTNEGLFGTLQILYDQIEFNNNSNPDDDDISITDEAAAMLLSSTVISRGIIALDYRQFTKVVDDVIAYASSRGVTEITSQTLKNRQNESFVPGFFEGIDREQCVDGFHSIDDAITGYVNGLAVGPMMNGILIKVQSVFYDGISQNGKNAHFSLTDQSSEMVSEDTTKGYQLAVDFVRYLLTQTDIGMENFDQTYRF